MSGQYVLTEDQSISTDIDKEYYTREFVQVDDPFGSPFKEGYYEKDEHDQYYKSKDMTVNAQDIYYILQYNLVDNPVAEDLGSYYEPIDISWTEYEIFSEIDEPTGNPSAQSYYVYDSEADEYAISEDTEVDNMKTYYQMNEIDLPFRKINGLSRSFKFGEDSIGGEAKLIISSALFEEDEDNELATIEVDPQYVDIQIQGDNITAFGLGIKYDEANSSGALDIGWGENSIFNISTNTDYFLNSTTGFR